MALEEAQRERERRLTANLLFPGWRDVIHKPDREITDQHLGDEAYRYTFSYLFEIAKASNAALKPDQFFARIENAFIERLASAAGFQVGPAAGVGGGRRGRPSALVATLNQLLSHLSEGSTSIAGDPADVQGDVCRLLFYLVLHQILECSIGEALGTREASPDDEDETRVSNESDASGQNEVSVLHTDLSRTDLCGRIWRIVAFELNAKLAREGVEGFTWKSNHRWRLGSDRTLREFEERTGISRQSGITFAALLLTLVADCVPGELVAFEAGTDETLLRVTLQPPLVQFLNRMERRHQAVPLRAPMIAPPLPWQTSHGTSQGGFYANELPFFKMPWKNGKLRDFVRVINGGPVAHEEDADETVRRSLDIGFRAINLCQMTRWRVNMDMWAVVRTLLTWREELNDAGGRRATALDEAQRIFPRQALAELFEAAGWKSEAPSVMQENWKAWLRSAAFDREYREDGITVRFGPGARAGSFLARATIGDAYGRSSIYFAYQADTRGRIYPVTGLLSPQGDDLMRSLLEFAEGKPLGNEAAAQALAIHGSAMVADATLCHDLGLLPTAPTDAERMRWVLSQQDDICACAVDPLKNTWWRDHAKDPFMFLAFCFAWKRYVEKGFKAQCHLPVHVDGSCNGLQHIAALTGDRSLAEATNVVATPISVAESLAKDAARKRDIYSEVGKTVTEWVQKTISSLDAASPNSPALEGERGSGPGTSERLKRFLTKNLEQLVTRGLAKNVVMVIPYGAGLLTYAETIRDELARQCMNSENVEIGAGDGAIPAERWVGSRYVEQLRIAVPEFMKMSFRSEKAFTKALQRAMAPLAQVLAPGFHDALSTLFPSIERFKSSLRAAARPVLKQGLPLMWVTPCGLPVIQSRFRFEERKIDSSALGNRLRIRMTIRELADDIDLHAQERGVLPNYIHSLDASHLYLTVLHAAAQGVTAFSVVHDSFGTHACDVPALQACIREAFVELYRKPEAHLGFFHAWIQALAGDETEASRTLVAWMDSSGQPEDAMRSRLLSLARHWRAMAAEPGTPSEGEVHAPVRRRTSRKQSTERLVLGDGVVAGPEWLDGVRKAPYFFS